MTISRALVDPERERLLDVDVLACVQRVDGNRRMPMVGYGDDDRVEVLHVEHTTVVLERLGTGRRFPGLIDLRGIHIAHRTGVGVQLQKCVHDADAARSAADQAQAHAVVGAENA